MFKPEQGGLMYAKWIERRFTKLLTLCGYEENFCRVQDLRGQYVDIMHLCKVPIVYISGQVGHSSPKVTVNSYTQILSELPIDANNAMDNLIFGPTMEKNQSKQAG